MINCGELLREVSEFDFTHFWLALVKVLQCFSAMHRCLHFYQRWYKYRFQYL